MALAASLHASFPSLRREPRFRAGYCCTTCSSYKILSWAHPYAFYFLLLVYPRWLRASVLEPFTRPVTCKTYFQ